MIEAFVHCRNLPRWKAEASVAIFLSWVLYFVHYPEHLVHAFG
jgi:hypothetical protein